MLCIDFNFYYEHELIMDNIKDIDGWKFVFIQNNGWIALNIVESCDETEYEASIVDNILHIDSITKFRGESEDPISISLNVINKLTELTKTN